MEELILVDERDRAVGIAEKLSAHRDGGKLHRAFSILIHDPEGRMLLQLRSRRKYHFGGLWTNTCCGHPRPGESLDQAVHRRLREELGFETSLRELFSFIYRAEDPPSGLSEYEYLHVFHGVFEGTPVPDPAEVDDYEWVETDWLRHDLDHRPERYSPWFRLAFARAAEWIGERTILTPIGPGAAGDHRDDTGPPLQGARSHDPARLEAR
jgi:isopentenyl-diphosphate delta-isomerase